MKQPSQRPTNQMCPKYQGSQSSFVVANIFILWKCSYKYAFLFNTVFLNEVQIKSGFSTSGEQCAIFCSVTGGAVSQHLFPSAKSFVFQHRYRHRVLRFQPLHIYIHNSHHMVEPIQFLPVLSLTCVPSQIRPMFSPSLHQPKLILFPVQQPSLFFYPDCSCLFHNPFIEDLICPNCLNTVDAPLCQSRQLC